MASLDPIAPDVLADLMFASAVTGHRHDIVALRRGDRAWAVTLEASGNVVAGMAVSAEVGEAVAARLVSAARIPCDRCGHVARVGVRVGTLTAELVVSMGADGARIEIQRMVSGEHPAALKRCPRCGTFTPAQQMLCDVDRCPLDEVVDNPVAGGTIGVYAVGERLGAGAQGEVLAAVRALLGRPVAIKLLHRSLAHHPSIARRFLSEARAASRCRHPNVVEVTDYGLLRDGRPFLVMERLAGEPLEGMLARSGALAPRAALLVAREVAAALEAAHAAGVTHNDLKPANVVLLKDSTLEAPRLKLVDFGAASLGEDDGALIGTPAYMAPERAAGDPTDARADLYALGVMLYEMIAGALPFSGGTPCAVLFAQVWQEPPPLKSPQARRLPSALVELVTRALAKDPAHRHPNARELGAQIEIALAALHSPWRNFLG